MFANAIASALAAENRFSQSVYRGGLTPTD